MRKLLALEFIISLIVLVFSGYVSAQSYSSLQDYEESIDYSCQVDTNCEIKDVHNCCGYYPKCTNKNAFVNATAVTDICEREGLSSVCGWPDIDYCECVNNRCVGKQGQPEPECAVDEDCPSRQLDDNSLTRCIDGKCKIQKNCPEGSITEEERCVKNLSNGIKVEIKIMPETASEKAIERLGELGFNVTLKEVGKGNNTRVVYELTGKKEGKFLGIFKIMTQVSAQVDAETGNVKVIKPWWAFLTSGV